MKAVIVSTDHIIDVTVPGPHESKVVCLARVWEGVTDKGVEFTAYIPLVQTLATADNTEFEAQLREHKKPNLGTRHAIDARRIL